MGAETGRAFYWGAYAGDGQDVRSPRTRAAMLRLRFEPNLVGAPRERLQEIRSRWRGWVDTADALAHTGLDGLDVVYAEQRVRRWGRSELQPEGAPTVPAFASAPMTRALASLPLRDRLEDGWQRRFVAARAPELAAAAVPRTPQSVRSDTATLRMRQAKRALGRAPRPQRAAVVWHEQEPWKREEAYIRWLRDDVFASEVVRTALGRRWADEQREKFAAGDPQAARLARLASGPVALADAVRRLS